MENPALPVFITQQAITDTHTHTDTQREREWAAPDTNNLKQPLALAYAAEFLTIAR